MYYTTVPRVSKDDNNLLRKQKTVSLDSKKCELGTAAGELQNFIIDDDLFFFNQKSPTLYTYCTCM